MLNTIIENPNIKYIIYYCINTYTQPLVIRQTKIILVIIRRKKALK